MAGFSFLHTTLMALSRKALFPLVGLGSYYYGIMPVRYLMEFSNDVISYWICVGFVYLFDHYRESRDREVRTAQLETQLAQAQLQALRLQLQPHFLFNAMNTISSLVYENPRAADEMIARLSDLLRMTMRDSGVPEVTLEQELELLGLYNGQLGNGTFSIYYSFAMPVHDLAGVIAIAAGGAHNLALKSDGTVWAWGSNSSGQLGTNLVDESRIPARKSHHGGGQALLYIRPRCQTPEIRHAPLEERRIDSALVPRWRTERLSGARVPETAAKALGRGLADGRVYSPRGHFQRDRGHRHPSSQNISP